MDIFSMYPEYLRHFNRDDYRTAFEKYKTESEGFADSGLRRPHNAFNGK